MEDYHFRCFHASWETEPFLKAGLPGHDSCNTLTLSAPQGSNGSTTDDERDHHFLDGCFRCGRLLGRNMDIFMYSEECRQQEMDADETKERSSKQQPAAATKRWRKQQRQMHVWLPPHLHVAIGAAAAGVATPRLPRRTNRLPHIWEAVASKMNRSVRRRLPNLWAWVFGRCAMSQLRSGELRRCGREPNMPYVM
ncbi:uncharacterized protein LOC8071587 isoform X2 [Sorghum bicolor]|uniref:uncharacterized protein LOC8071587 isoform X2 n=1 Tax=Sorghum bicolor TaxID=4558 RepID=UPI000B42390C|nr:uncharacterized protein LOC8071587 isoform X2 [Sorghum bicolor]|eukprot:XP_021317467.1 uncharacterized protein LOC8071587 isoform X2 [Sorghum bicolor]